jgi:hypothetical protein
MHIQNKVHGNALQEAGKEMGSQAEWTTFYYSPHLEDEN